MYVKRPILTNPCDKSFEDLKKLQENQFYCSSCNNTVINISALNNLDYDDYKGQCIIASFDQVRDMRFLHPLKRFLVAAFLVFGSSLFIIPKSYGQIATTTRTESQTVEGALSGRVVGSRGYGVSNATVTLVFKDGSRIETTTDYEGDFFIEVPKGIKGKDLQLIIEYKNEDAVISQTIPVNGKFATINNLGDIRIKLKQEKWRNSRRYTVGFY